MNKYNRFVGDWYIQEFCVWNPKFRFVKILLNKLRDKRSLNLIYLNFLCVPFDQLACPHEWLRTATHMRRTDMPLTPFDKCARDCCILVCIRDSHGVRASCRARLLTRLSFNLSFNLIYQKVKVIGISKS